MSDEMGSPESTTPMWRLAIETSCLPGSIALGKADGLVESLWLDGHKRHAAELLPAISDLCSAHAAAAREIDVVIVSVGPGSFTGLRVGVTVARMLALASDAKLVAVSTLEVIAQNAMESQPALDHVVVMQDAQRGSVYAVVFDRSDEGFSPRCDPIEVDGCAFLGDCGLDRNVTAVLGGGVKRHADAIGSAGWRVLPESTSLPTPEVLYRLGVRYHRDGRHVNRGKLVPTYIRRPSAEEVYDKRQAEC